jgi:hypothetical protein
MSDTRLRPPALDHRKTSLSIPSEQTRALDRRHSLDEQQRTYQGISRSPHFSRTRPPS